MANVSWETSHAVVKLRDDLKSGELPLHKFAADLYEGMMQNGKRSAYEKPRVVQCTTFFSSNEKRQRTRSKGPTWPRFGVAVCLPLIRSSVKLRGTWPQHIIAALKVIATIDDQTAKLGTAAEERCRKSYPFHPELTEVLYTKWAVGIGRFQMSCERSPSRCERLRYEIKVRWLRNS